MGTREDITIYKKGHLNSMGTPHGLMHNLALYILKVWDQVNCPEELLGLDSVSDRLILTKLIPSAVYHSGKNYTNLEQSEKLQNFNLLNKILWSIA